MATSILLADSSHAALVESLSTSSTYTFDFSPDFAGLNSGIGNTKVLHSEGSVVNQATWVDMNYGVLTATDASFFFLHNIQCKGFCSVSVSTWVTDAITNTGPDPVDLRFDTDITAGHLGIVLNSNSKTSGSFDFRVTQETNGIGNELYKATGQISSAGAEIVTSDGVAFNNLKSYQDGAQTGLDWDKTGLSLLLGQLDPGETTSVTYQSHTYLSSFGVCTDVVLCDGVQVAFGDPRNNGGIIIQNFAARTLLSKAEPIGFVLDRGFDMAELRAQVVNLSVLPEPSSWAMMIVGFGLMGAATRRRMPGLA